MPKQNLNYLKTPSDLLAEVERRPIAPRKPSQPNNSKAITSQKYRETQLRINKLKEKRDNLTREIEELEAKQSRRKKFWSTQKVN